MADCSATVRSWGYRITGGADKTTLFALGKRLNIKSLLFFPNTAANTCAISDGGDNAMFTIKGAGTAGIETQIWIDGPVDGLTIDLQEATDVLLVFIE